MNRPRFAAAAAAAALLPVLGLGAGTASATTWPVDLKAGTGKLVVPARASCRT
jgi:hypothetical protein